MKEMVLQRISERAGHSTGIAASPDVKEEAFSKKFQRYIAMSPTDKEAAEPVLFWKNLHSELPMHASLARRYLSIPCPSVTVEPIFSIKGIMLDGRRRLIEPYRVSVLSFIHDNYEALKPQK